MFLFFWIRYFLSSSRLYDLPSLYMTVSFYLLRHFIYSSSRCTIFLLYTIFLSLKRHSKYLCDLPSLCFLHYTIASLRLLQTPTRWPAGRATWRGRSITTRPSPAQTYSPRPTPTRGRRECSARWLLRFGTRSKAEDCVYSFSLPFHFLSSSLTHTFISFLSLCSIPFTLFFFFFLSACLSIYLFFLRLCKSWNEEWPQTTTWAFSLYCFFASPFYLSFQAFNLDSRLNGCCRSCLKLSNTLYRCCSTRWPFLTLVRTSWAGQCYDKWAMTTTQTPGTRGNIRTGVTEYRAARSVSCFTQAQRSMAIIKVIYSQ